jgi:hypothetical protein
MAEQRKFNAHLNRKGLDNHITVDQAREMAQHQGRTYLFIVAARSGPKVVGEDGSEDVALIPDLVELVPAEHEERVRAVQRAFYMARPEQHGQAAFEGPGDGEQSVDSALDDLGAAVTTDDDAWGGDPEEPLDGSEERRLAAVPDRVKGELIGCAFPGCVLTEHPDGDHQTADGSVIDPEAVEQ